MSIKREASSPDRLWKLVLARAKECDVRLNFIMRDRMNYCGVPDRWDERVLLLKPEAGFSTAHMLCISEVLVVHVPIDKGLLKPGWG